MIIDNISKRLAQHFIDCNIIKFDDFDVYMYGLQLLFSTIFKFSGLFILAWLSGSVAETLVFVTVFGLLRVNAGGYHANTYLKCFLMTVILNFSDIAIVKYLPIENTIYFIVVTLSAATALVLKYAPVETPNKQITADEYPIYRFRSILVIMVESAMILGIYLICPQLRFLCDIAAAAALFEAATLTPLLPNKV